VYTKGLVIMLEIVIPLYPGVTQLDFTGPHQVLSRMPGAHIQVASVGGRDIEAEGLKFAGLSDLAAIAACDVLLIPGGLSATGVILDPGLRPAGDHVVASDQTVVVFAQHR
jgi:putative intracellular protease/amidase